LVVAHRRRERTRLLLMVAGAGAFVASAFAVGIVLGARRLARMSDATPVFDIAPPVSAPSAAAPGLPTPRTMVRIDGGELLLRGKTVIVAPFEIDLNEVTSGAYAECVSKDGCEPSGTSISMRANPEDAKKYDVFCNGGRPERSRHPMNCVSFWQATSFCAWSGKRIPREEEWELAARGSVGRDYPWGSAPPDSTRLNACGAECEKLALPGVSLKRLVDRSDGFEATAPVGSFAAGATPDGVLDLAGNVWEWTETIECDRGSAPCKGAAQIARGGGWYEGASEGVRATARTKLLQDARYVDVGFRCVR
jgi:formylglycine-generating enzyme required for sulfatase activity